MDPGPCLDPKIQVQIRLDMDILILSKIWAFLKNFVVSAGRDLDPGPNVNTDLVQLDPDSVKMTKFDRSRSIT